ncbi:MAG TPA: M23 family metallopeptidase, partial [Turneriella sp.]|nr:M23 family metallopeptidase [Turneriella sp.]
SVMARTVLNHDTISSVNRLASLWDVSAGDEWLLPNVRGVAASGSRASVAKKFGKPPESLVSIPGRENYFFVTGLHFEEVESAFFNLRAFIRPVPGRQTSAFGVRSDPFTDKKRFHRGIDLACPIGTKVVASAEGEIIFAGKKGGYGNAVLIRHRNGYITLYGHLSKFAVKKGARVKQGQKIAYSGMTGRATGPHVHFEVRREGKPERPNFHMVKM